MSATAPGCEVVDPDPAKVLGSVVAALLPLGVGANFVMYNKDLFDQAGVEAMQTLGEPLRRAVIFRQSVHHGFERNYARCCDRPGLAHVAAHHAAEGAGTLDKGSAAAQHGADRCRKALGNAKAHRVGVLRNLARLRFQGCGGIEDARTIEVDRDTPLPRQAVHPAHVVQWQHRAA